MPAKWQQVLKALGSQKPTPDMFRGLASLLVPELHSRGEVHQLLAEYLGSRADLLSLEDCSSLGKSNRECRAIPAGEFADLVRKRLGPESAEILAELDPDPHGSDALFQTHRSRSARGEELLIRLLRPGIGEVVQQGLSILRRELGPSSLVESFSEDLHHRISLEDEAAAIRILAEDYRDLDVMKGLRPLARFCTSEILVMERCPGAASAQSRFAFGICFAWLRQTVMGQVFPSAPCEAALYCAGSGTVISVQGPYARTKEHWRRNISRYLLALAAQNPEQAADWLLTECIPEKGALSPEEMRRRFRLCSPEWERQTDWLDTHRTFATFLTHWRLVRRGGWMPSRQQQSFLRGLTILTLAHAPSAQEDFLGESLADLRPHLLVYRMRETVKGLQSGELFGGDTMAPADVLRGISGLGAKLGRLAIEAGRDRRVSLYRFITLLLLLAAAGVLAGWAVPLLGRPAELLGAGIVMALGTAALTAAFK